MARKQYPSDGRRFILSYEDELDDTRLSTVSGDCYRFFSRLKLMMNRAKAEDSILSMDRRSVMACACRDTFRKALKIAEEGEIAGFYEMSRGCKHETDRLCTHCALQVHSQSTRSALVVHLRFRLSNPLESLTSTPSTNTSTKTSTIHSPTESEPAARAHPSEPEKPRREEETDASFERHLRLVAAPKGFVGPAVEDDERRAWLEDQRDLILAEADNPKGKGSVPSITIRYFRHYLKSERSFRGWAARQEVLARARAEDERARCVSPPPAPMVTVDPEVRARGAEMAAAGTPGKEWLFE